MTNDLAKNETVGGVPAWARERSTGASIGNIDASDLKPPRLKLLAGQSPEVMDQVPGAQPGNFWITILNRNMGQSVTGTPIYLHKSYVLWAPREMEHKGPLAVASDAIHWDVPDQTFEVKFYGNPKVYKWHIKKTVMETGLHKFGSSQDDNPSSKPAAVLTYDVLWLIDLGDGRKQLCVFTNSRTGLTPTQTFLSTSQTIGIDQYYQRYKIVVQRKTGPTGDFYFTYDYQYLGAVENIEQGVENRKLWEQYSRSGFVVDRADEGEGPARSPLSQPQHKDEDDIPF